MIKLGVKSDQVTLGVLSPNHSTASVTFGPSSPIDKDLHSSLCNSIARSNTEESLEVLTKQFIKKVHRIIQINSASAPLPASEILVERVPIKIDKTLRNYVSQMASLVFDQVSPFLHSLYAKRYQSRFSLDQAKQINHFSIIPNSTELLSLITTIELKHKKYLEIASLYLISNPESFLIIKDTIDCAIKMYESEKQTSGIYKTEAPLPSNPKFRINDHTISTKHTAIPGISDRITYLALSLLTVDRLASFARVSKVCYQMVNNPSITSSISSKDYRRFLCHRIVWIKTKNNSEVIYHQIVTKVKRIITENTERILLPEPPLPQINLSRELQDIIRLKSVMILGKWHNFIYAKLVRYLVNNKNYSFEKICHILDMYKNPKYPDILRLKALEQVEKRKQSKILLSNLNSFLSAKSRYIFNVMIAQEVIKYDEQVKERFLLTNIEDRQNQTSHESHSAISHFLSSIIPRNYIRIVSLYEETTPFLDLLEPREYIQRIIRCAQTVLSINPRRHMAAPTSHSEIFRILASSGPGDLYNFLLRRLD